VELVARRSVRLRREDLSRDRVGRLRLRGQFALVVLRPSPLFRCCCCRRPSRALASRTPTGFHCCLCGCGGRLLAGEGRAGAAGRRSCGLCGTGNGDGEDPGGGRRGTRSCCERVLGLVGGLRRETELVETHERYVRAGGEGPRGGGRSVRVSEREGREAPAEREDLCVRREGEVQSRVGRVQVRGEEGAEGVLRERERLELLLERLDALNVLSGVEKELVVALNAGEIEFNVLVASSAVAQCALLLKELAHLPPRDLVEAARVLYGGAEGGVTGLAVQLLVVTLQRLSCTQHNTCTQYYINNKQCILYSSLLLPMTLANIHTLMIR